ncbi:MAG: glycosyltransferase family 2 protein [Pyrinomonadaceae bacterium]
MTTVAENKGIAVVVPSHNHERYIATCLRSIMKQSLPPAHLLVIDDGSTDQSPKQISSILNDCPFPSELIVRENRGLSATLNQGLSLTRGEYFAYLSSDDLWLPGFLMARTQSLATRPAAVLGYGHAYFVDADNNIVDCTGDWAVYLDGDARPMLLRAVGPMSPTVLYRRSFLEQFGWNEKVRLEDYELYLKLSTVGEFAFDEHVLSAWRWHDANTSRNQTMMLEEHLAALAAMAPQLGLDAAQLTKLRRSVSFCRAEDFCRVGDIKTAKRLLIENMTAASPGALFRTVARVLLPHNIQMTMRQRKQKLKTRHLGKIDI